MDKFFVAIFNFLHKRRWLMLSLLICSSVIFVIYGLKLYYEEDISKLLPATESSTNSGLAFSNLRVKDKIFIQFVGKDSTLTATELTEACDEFVEQLLAKDTATQYIANVLYKLDDDVMVMAMDYALLHLPTLVDTAIYAQLDSVLTPQYIEQQMAENSALIQNDMDGSITELVCQDPLALRKVLLNSNQLSNGLGGGFKFYNRHLISPDSTTALAFLAPNFQSFDSKSNGYLVELLEQEIESYTQAHPNIEILFHGAPVRSVFNSRQIKHDLMLTIGISLLIICMVILCCFRNRSTLLLLLSPVGYGTFFALACMYWLQGQMSLMAIGIGAVVMGVALSYCLHVLTHYKYVSDPIQVLRDQSTPVCLGCLTTIGAFIGLLFTQSDLLRDFGLFASFGLLGTTFFALVFLPHFFRPESNRRSEKAFALLDKINAFPLDRQRWLIALIVTISIVSFFTSNWVEFDNDLKNIGYNEPKVIKSEQYYTQHTNAGLSSIYYAVAHNDLDSALFLNKQLLLRLDSLERLQLLESYSQTSKLFTPMAEQNSRIDAWKHFWSEERIATLKKQMNASASANNLQGEIFDPFFAIVESDYDAASLYDAGVLPESLLSNFIELCDNQYMVFTSVKLHEEHKLEVSTAVSTLPHAVVIDPFFYTNDMVRIVHNDFDVVLWISSIFVFLVLLLSYRSLSRALLGFLPMLLSWYIVQGVMGIFDIKFNLINIVISSFIFGIGVDYSIFVMDGLLANTRRNNLQLLTYHKTAIFFSAFVLITVVASLLFATHPAIQSIGVCTIIGMSATVLITYALQPLIFRMLMKSKLFAPKFGRKPRFKNTQEKE